MCNARERRYTSGVLSADEAAIERSATPSSEKMASTQNPYLNTREDAAFRFLGVPTLMRSTAETTNGAFGLMEHWAMPVGFASPYHTHHREDESFYVLEGEMAFVCGGKWSKAGPGTFVFGPREIAHGFKVVGNSPVSMLLPSSSAISSPQRVPAAEVSLDLSVGKMRLSPSYRSGGYFSKPRMYGTTGGRDPVLNSDPRFDRYLMLRTPVSIRRPTAE